MIFKIQKIIIDRFLIEGISFDNRSIGIDEKTNEKCILSFETVLCDNKKSRVYDILKDLEENGILFSNVHFSSCNMREFNGGHNFLIHLKTFQLSISCDVGFVDKKTNLLKSLKATDIYNL